MWHCNYGAGLRSFNPCLKASTVSLSISAFGKQFHCGMVCEKNEYLYSFVFWLSIRNLCLCLLLVLLSDGINISSHLEF
jgi:hypothetical protein